jgi:hypothetical protein
MRRRGIALVTLAAALAFGVTACGGEDFENEPRPAVPAEISVQISEQDVTVSPVKFGAGIANFTIANLGPTSTAVQIEGPTEGESEEIAPGNTGDLRLELATGDYEVMAADSNADPFPFTVGPDRESASDDLLLP